MVQLFPQGLFAPSAAIDPRAVQVLEAAVDRAASAVRPSDVLAAAVDAGDARVLSTLGQALAPGCSPRDLLEIISVYNPARKTASDFNGRRERFVPQTLAALDRFENELAAAGAGARESGLELLLAAVLRNLELDDREYLTPLNAPLAADRFAEQVQLAATELPPLIDEATGRLRADEFSEAAWSVLEGAAGRGAELGYDRLMPPHLFLALLGETEGVAEHLVRLQAQPDIGPGRVAQTVSDAFRLAARLKDPIDLTRNGLGEATLALLASAQKTARVWGTDRIESPHLLAALLADPPPRLASVLERPPLDLDLKRMKGNLDQHLRETRSGGRRETPFRLPTALLPSDDLTYHARTDGLPPARHLDRYFEPILRALHRRSKNHVVVTGQRGVGRTTLLHELARRAAAGEIPFLARKRFLWVSGKDVAPADSRDKLASVLTHATGRTDLILCADDLGPLLRGEQEAKHTPLLREALAKQQVHLIGTLTPWDFENLLADDLALRELFTRVSLEEPTKDEAVEMMKVAGDALGKEYRVGIDPGAAERAVVLSGDYVLNERLPAKAVKVLRLACEHLHYERVQKGQTRATVSADDVIRVVSDLTGVPAGTLAGLAERTDYERHLGEYVIGQEEAIAAVATELRLIKAGLNSPGKPASVMFFAGLTGVGKSELSKALARFYSASKRLQTYTMGNFTEAHSVSGIVGVAPGYVGHDQGGPLINDLNSDPYGVFLLDEAEKAHPDIWKPFLNLFDEGWVTDLRGVKAFADRAIFLLTSNAGQETISAMVREGRPMEAIIEAVREQLREVIHDRTGKPVFSPEFLARIKRIIVFKPLDRAAMLGIAKKLVRNLIKAWREKREKDVDVPDELVEYVADESDRLNTKAGGKEGGRIVGKLLSDLIDATIQREASEHEDEYKACGTVRLTFLRPATLPGAAPGRARVHVTFIPKEDPDAVGRVGRTAQELRQALTDGSRSVVDLRRAAAGCLQRLEAELGQFARSRIGGAVDVERAVEQLRSVCTGLESLVRDTDGKARQAIEDLVTTLERQP